MNNEESIFAEALSLGSSKERQQFLDQACGDDAQMRAEIEEMLRVQTGIGSFLNRPHPELQQAAPTVGLDSLDVETKELLPTNSLPVLEPCDTPGRIGKLGNYEVVEVVGQGGMGMVLRAWDTKLHRIVALKVMSAHLRSNPNSVSRFLREGRSAAAITHDHVVKIHAVDDSLQPPLLAMEFVEGETLGKKIKATGAFSLSETLRIGHQIAQGLAAAHAQNLIHRDITPGNILLERDTGRAKITDFGLARAVDSVDLTRTGMILGTPQYMSPEQASGEDVDHRSDLFSLGSVLYLMCTGKPAFPATTTIGAINRICHGQATPVRSLNPDIPVWLEVIIHRLLEKDRERRIQTANEVAELLAGCLRHLENPRDIALPDFVKSLVAATPAMAIESTESSNRRWLFAGVAVAGVIALLGVMSTRFLPDVSNDTNQPSAEVVAPAVEPEELVNVAPKGAASQTSSDYPDGVGPHDTGAQKAINQSLLGGPATTSFGETDPQWQVVLDADYAISTIVLTNNGTSLRDIMVEIHEVPAAVDAPGAPVFVSPVLSPKATNKITIDVTQQTGQPIIGRMVRVIRLSDNDSVDMKTGARNRLSLNEVEVFAHKANSGYSRSPQPVYINQEIRSRKLNPPDPAPPSKWVTAVANKNWRKVVNQKMGRLKWDPDNPASYALALPPMVLAGDLELYRRKRKDLLSKTGDVFGPRSCEHASSTALLLPSEGPILEQATELARRFYVLQDREHHERLRSAAIYSLAKYRNGEYEEALAVLAPVVKEDPTLLSGTRSLGWTALAVATMSHQRLGHTNRAAELLANCRRLSEHPVTIDYVVRITYASALYLEVEQLMAAEQPQDLPSEKRSPNEILTSPNWEWTKPVNLSQQIVGVDRPSMG